MGTCLIPLYYRRSIEKSVRSLNMQQWGMMPHVMKTQHCSASHRFSIIKHKTFPPIRFAGDVIVDVSTCKTFCILKFKSKFEVTLCMRRKKNLLIAELIQMQIIKQTWIRRLSGCLEILFLYSPSELTSHTHWLNGAVYHMDKGSTEGWHHGVFVCLWAVQTDPSEHSKHAES